MNKAIILDRDGVICFETGKYEPDLSGIKLIPGIVEVLRTLSREFKLFCITNQGGIDKGILSIHNYLVIEEYLRHVFFIHGVIIEEFFFCRHHPDCGLCICRKPHTIFLERIIHKWCIDPASSYFIGDMDRDILCGRALGFRTILIPSNLPPPLWYKLIFS